MGDVSEYLFNIRTLADPIFEEFFDELIYLLIDDYNIDGLKYYQ